MLNRNITYDVIQSISPRTDVQERLVDSPYNDIEA